MAISKAKIAPGSKITSHPVAKNDLLADYQYQEHSPVVQDGNLITSRCPGTSFDFALAIVTALTDQATAESVKHGLYT
jgi:protein DJ-1